MAAMWLWVSCGWCGFTGCAAPIGDACPQCLRQLEPTPTPASEDRGAETSGEASPSNAA